MIPDFKKRWHCRIRYRIESRDREWGEDFSSVLVTLDELSELQDIIEKGPSFEAIQSISIEYSWGELKTIQETFKE